MNYEESKFQYLISSSLDERLKNNCKVSASLTLQWNVLTTCLTESNLDKSIYIVGFCVDAWGELKRDDIPSYLVNVVTSIKVLQKEMTRFAGQYIIIYRENEQVYVLGDASNSLAIYYYFGNKEATIGSSEFLVSSHLGLKKDISLVNIERKSNLGLGMPVHLTRYKNLLAMLPNHFMDIDKLLVERYIDSSFFSNKKNKEDILSRSHKLLKNISKEYSEHYSFLCPLTSGADSRVYLSYFFENKPDVFTFKHPHFTSESAEINVPKEICKDLGLKYSTVPPIDINKVRDVISNSFLKEAGFDERALQLGLTASSISEGRALLDGAIIGQVGKASLFRKIPYWATSVRLMQCKSHNYDAATYECLKGYSDGIKNRGLAKHIQDLFSLEIRVGRWGSRSTELYNLLGVDVLNIFNNQDLIFNFMMLSKKYRVNYLLHNYLIDRNGSNLIAYKYNQDEPLYAKAIGDRFLFLVASYFKFFHESLKKIIKG